MIYENITIEAEHKPARTIFATKAHPEISVTRFTFNRFLAGFGSKFLTLPFDVVKKRVQTANFLVEGSWGGSISKPVAQFNGLCGPFRLARHIVETEGLRGLFRG